MTREGFIAAVEGGRIIHCSCIEERNDVLQYLLDCDFKIGEASLKYLEPGNYSDEFLSPGISQGFRHISCYRNSSLGRGVTLIQYNEISSLIEGPPPSQNETSDDEFRESLLNLIAG